MHERYMTCPTTERRRRRPGFTTEDAMALRTYKDPDGTEWRVWRVVPDAISFSTLDAAYRDGWLCFERVDGTDRRRLSMARVPDEWDILDDSRLEALRQAAEPAMRRSTPTGGIDTGALRRDKDQGR
jgi:hypothetical protein